MSAKRTLSLLSGFSLAHPAARVAQGLRGFPAQEMAGGVFSFIAHFIMDRFEATIMESSLFMAVMGTGFASVLPWRCRF